MLHVIIRHFIKIDRQHTNRPYIYIYIYDHIGAAIFAVFDGHGGGECSKYLQENFMYHVMNQQEQSTKNSWYKAVKNGIAEAEERYCKQARRVGDDSGACLITCVLSEDSYIVAGVGDCRCIAGIGWNKRNKKVIALSTDHTAKVESTRIRRAGGRVLHGRLDGILEPSRTIGDLDVKDKGNTGLIATPEMRKGKIEHDKLYVFVLASDGLWDVFKNHEVISFIHRAIENKKTGNPCKQTAESKNIADQLVAEASRRGSRDDITAIVCIVWLP